MAFCHVSAARVGDGKAQTQGCDADLPPPQSGIPYTLEHAHNWAFLVPDISSDGLLGKLYCYTKGLGMQCVIGHARCLASALCSRKTLLHVVMASAAMGKKCRASDLGRSRTWFKVLVQVYA